MLKLSSLKIKHQILSAGVVSLAVVLGIIWYFYSFTGDSLTQSSSRLIGLTTSQYADKVERNIESRSRLFAEWAREDVFGLSIEFNTTAELGDNFSAWMRNSEGFLLLALTDRSGKVIEYAWHPEFAGANELKGRQLPEFGSVDGDNDLDVTYVSSPVLAEIDLPNPATFLYRRWAYSSSGDRIGAFVAYLDRRSLDRELESCATTLRGFGLPNACVALVLDDRSTAAGEVGINTTWSPGDRSNWYSAMHTGIDRETVVVELAEQPTFVGGRTVLDPSATLGNANANSDLTFGCAVPESDITAQLQKQVIGILGVGIFCSLMVGLLSWLIAGRISRRLNSLAKVATEMSRGDIEHELTVDSADEVGVLSGAFMQLRDYINEMATVARRISEHDLTVRVEARSERDVLGRSFSVMVGNLSSIIRQLTENARELSGAAGTIATTSEQMAKGVGEQKDRVGQISAAIEEMTATIVQSSTNAEDASRASQTASDTATSGGDIVRDTIHGMQQIAEVTRQSSSSIAKLASSADEIGRIVGVIDDIADQTNLLALNAAIEAARAGEQGRGFAVVADEVRKLAERTSSATAEIGQMIRGIQEQTEEAVSATEAGVQEIDKGRALADKAGNALNEIVGVSQQVMEMIRQIASASVQQTDAAEQMSQSVQLIASNSESAAEGANQSAAAAEQLNRQADGLEKIVSQFKLTVDNG
ncbi:methyl-accepting chemotaxis protein [bacterium]|nr:methyl-accepting chemotaxis protein [bacterium]